MWSDWIARMIMKFVRDHEIGAAPAPVHRPATNDDIPAYLEPFFAAKTAKPSGFACTSLTAQADITN
jgi:hypothetical protein